MASDYGGEQIGPLRPVSKLSGRFPGFQACFGLPEQPNPGPENIKSGLNGVAMPRFEPILSGSAAVDSPMAVVALGAPERPQIHPKQRFSCFSGPLGGPPCPWASLLSLRDAHCYCHPIVPFAGCRCVAFLPNKRPLVVVACRGLHLCSRN